MKNIENNETHSQISKDISFCENSTECDVNSDSMEDCSCANENEQEQSQSTQSGDFKRKNRMKFHQIVKDWNTTFSKLDRASKTEHKDDYGYKTLCNLTNNNNVYNVWCRRNPDCRTFSRKRVCNLDLKQSRIDYFLSCRNVSQYVQYVRYKDTSFSDHTFVEMKVIFDNVERGPGVWILDNTLLEKEEYVAKVIKIIEESKNCPLFETETLIWWDNLKYQIKKFSQVFSKRIAKENNAEYYTLQHKIERIRNRIAEGDNVNIEQYENLKLELSVFRGGKV
ncbi:unnamed protein product [Mytilus coruscus]|uniref:Endonuclease/exonuclease/phosphatase domain-containing protein n=1 Tax=Mytilus coruscus TaxID=42192 RepID=A0A6J8EUC4_MYTCO|nr:unnamed protein product [Mytilus coruscus]